MSKNSAYEETAEKLRQLLAKAQSNIRTPQQSFAVSFNVIPVDHATSPWSSLQNSTDSENEAPVEYKVEKNESRTSMPTSPSKKKVDTATSPIKRPVLNEASVQASVSEPAHSVKNKILPDSPLQELSVASQETSQRSIRVKKSVLREVPAVVEQNAPIENINPSSVFDSETAKQMKSLQKEITSMNQDLLKNQAELQKNQHDLFQSQTTNQIKTVQGIQEQQLEWQFSTMEKYRAFIQKEIKGAISGQSEILVQMKKEYESALKSIQEIQIMVNAVNQTPIIFKKPVIQVQDNIEPRAEQSAREPFFKQHPQNDLMIPNTHFYSTITKQVGQLSGMTKKVLSQLSKQTKALGEEAYDNVVKEQLDKKVQLPAKEPERRILNEKASTAQTKKPQKVPAQRPTKNAVSAPARTESPSRPPPFYNVMLSNQPIFLRRTSVKPPAIQKIVQESAAITKHVQVTKTRKETVREPVKKIKTRQVDVQVEAGPRSASPVRKEILSPVERSIEQNIKVLPERKIVTFDESIQTETPKKQLVIQKQQDSLTIVSEPFARSAVLETKSTITPVADKSDFTAQSQSPTRSSFAQYSFDSIQSSLNGSVSKKSVASSAVETRTFSQVTESPPSVLKTARTKSIKQEKVDISVTEISRESVSKPEIKEILTSIPRKSVANASTSAIIHEAVSTATSPEKADISHFSTQTSIDKPMEELRNLSIVSKESQVSQRQTDSKLKSDGNVSEPVQEQSKVSSKSDSSNSKSIVSSLGMSTLSTNMSEGEIMTDILSEGELGEKLDPDAIMAIIKKYYPTDTNAHDDSYSKKADSIVKALNQGQTKQEIIKSILNEHSSSLGSNSTEKSIGQADSISKDFSFGELDITQTEINRRKQVLESMEYNVDASSGEVRFSQLGPIPSVEYSRLPDASKLLSPEGHTIASISSISESSGSNVTFESPTKSKFLN